MKRIIRKLRVKTPTVDFFRTARKTPNFGIINTLHGYLYARWPYFWISIGTGRHKLIRRMNFAVNFITNALMRFPADRPWIDENGLHRHGKQRWFLSRRDQFADTYHGKVIRLNAARQLVSLNQSISLENLEKVIPYSTARDLVIENPNRILALECPCRAAQPNPCLPLDVCFIMGNPFIDLVAAHHAKRSRFIDRSEAIDILLKEAERGHVHHAFFKEAALGRFFAICNCCSCCCGAMQAQRNGVPMLASSGYVSSVDQKACSGCGTCEQLCQFKAIAMDGDYAVIDTAACMGCGVCAFHCPQGTIKMQNDPTRSAPLELDRLIQGQ
jgi:ferredoxin